MNALHAPPDGLALIRAVANMPVGWVTAMAELVDNALDAGATEIRIAISRKEFRIEDNGSGCDDPVRIVRIGDHREHETTEIGEYGIGAKHALLWVGGEGSALHIISDHGGKRRTLSMKWAEYARAWNLRPPMVTDVDADSGTSITVRPCDRRLPYGQERDRLMDELGYMFSEAISRGVRIHVKGSRGGVQEVTPWSMPPAAKSVETTVNVGGRNANVFCAIAEGPNPRCGFTYLRGWRVIEPASANGCGGRNPSRVCGVVRLAPDWPIGTHKNEIVEGRDKLYAAVSEACDQILEEAHTRGRDLTGARFSKAVNALIAGAIGGPTKRARRNGKHRATGTKQPTGTGSPHRDADDQQPGATFDERVNGSKKDGASFKVWYDGFGRSYPVGDVSGRYVRLNLDNRGVREDHDSGNETASAKTALAVLAHHAATTEGEQILIGISSDDDFVSIYSELMNRLGKETAANASGAA